MPITSGVSAYARRATRSRRSIATEPRSSEALNGERVD
jgi:hypothetical protein